MNTFYPLYLDTTIPADQQAAQLVEVRNRLEKARVVAVDIETEGMFGVEKKEALDFRKATIVGVSIAWNDTEPLTSFGAFPVPPGGALYPSLYFPLRHKLIPAPQEGVWDLLRWLLTRTDAVKVFHHAVFDIPMLYHKEGISVARPYLDTALISWIHDETQARGLKPMAKAYLGWEPMEFSAYKGLQFGSIPPSVVYRYACQDAYLTLRLMEFLAGRLHPAGQKLLMGLEVPTQATFLGMHYRGIPIDMHLVHRYQDVCKQVVEQCRDKALDLLGKVNLNSPMQLKAAFSRQGLDIKNAQEETLRRLDHPAAKWIIQSKKFAKIGTYLNAICEWVWPDGRIHPVYLQWYFDEAIGRKGGTETGRSSAHDPAVQTFPSKGTPIPDGITITGADDLPRDKKGKVVIHIRRCWVAPPEWVFVKGDSSQVEPRIAGAITGEPMLVDTYTTTHPDGSPKNVYEEIGRHVMMKAGRMDVDITKATGGSIYKMFKQIVLGLAYGSGPDTVHEQLRKQDVDMELEEVKAIHKMVQQSLPQVCSMYPEWVKRCIQTSGFIETIFGRRRHFPKFHPRDRGMMRQAVNFAMGQSPAFDVMKRAMIRIDAEMKAAGLKAYSCGQIHDEVMVLCPHEEVAQVSTIMYRCITAPVPEFPIAIPLDAEIEVGVNYGDLYLIAPGEACPENLKEASQPPVSAPAQALSREEALQQVMAVYADVKACQKCDFFAQHGYRKIGMQGTVTEQIDLLWVATNPGEDDISSGVPMVGRTGSKLRQEAYLAGLPIPPDPKCLIINALWCYSPETEGILATHIGNCRPHMDRVLDVVRPKVIICLGSIAMRSVLRTAKSEVSAMAGKLVVLPTGSCVMVTYHPNFLLKSPGFEMDFRKHLGVVRQFLMGKVDAQLQLQGV